MKMGIEVVGDEEVITAQTRAYAEYRVFAALAKHTERVRRVRVTLDQVNQAETGGTCRCEVSVLLLDPAGRVRRRAGGQHPYAAINGAVERIAIAMARRVESAPI
jgi:ribosome-associated translation inhibitor RaiA